nr:uncharacterized protein LOC119173359 [Rhipicephalus microplus]
MCSSMASLLPAVCVAWSCLFSASARSFWKNEKHYHGTVNAFQVFGQFSDAAGVRDVSRDPMFKCLRANRTEYDLEARSANYVWSLNAGKGNPSKQVAVKYTGGDTPDAIITMVDSDPSTRKEGHVIYSNYKNCGISVMESLGHQCTLWVAYENRYSYPESCKRMHRKLCGEGVSLFDKEFCGDI